VLVENPDRKNHLKNAGVVGKIILERIFRKRDGRS
jgi:Ser-tRNA(Ala) deacylase AlaX